MSARGHVTRLKSRAEWLESRIEQAIGSEGSLGHARDELAALNWAIPILEELAEEIVTEARDVFAQRKAARQVNCAAKALSALAEVDFDRFSDLMADAPDAIVHATNRRMYGTAIIPDAAPGEVTSPPSTDPEGVRP